MPGPYTNTTNIPLQHMTYGQFGTQPTSQVQPTQETNFGPNFPSVNQQNQTSTMSSVYGAPTTPGGPQASPSGILSRYKSDHLPEYFTQLL